MNHKHLVRHLCVYTSVAAALALVGCDSGSGGGGGGSGTGGGASTTSSTSSGNTTSSSGNTTSSSGNTTTSSSGSTGNAIMCPTNFCSTIGMGGYAFGYSDSDPPAGKGTSTATLAADGSLCISGQVMALPANPTPADYSNDWGCGIGVNLDQAMGMMTAKNPFTLTGTGVTVNVNGVPSCTIARVVIDQNGATPAYCAPLTPGVEIPWSKFNTACWDGSGTALTGPPSSQALKVQFVTSMTACPFTNFCLTQVSL